MVIAYKKPEVPKKICAKNRQETCRCYDNVSSPGDPPSDETSTGPFTILSHHADCHPARMLRLLASHMPAARISGITVSESNLMLDLVGFRRVLVVKVGVLALQLANCLVTIRSEHGCSTIIDLRWETAITGWLHDSSAGCIEVVLRTSPFEHLG